ncbi:MAG TPA: hypothetical protein VMR45_01615 [Patescibacteria group bacterium]|nr:hypothetical protein [Patescibacteria group bacterium]
MDRLEAANLPVDYEQFKATLRSQRVVLSEGLVDDARVIERLGAPTKMLALVKYAGRIITRYPDRTLTSRPIEMPDRWRQDVAAKTLVGFLNSSHSPPDPNEFAANITTGDMLFAPSCIEAERRFARSLAHLDHVGTYAEWSSQKKYDRIMFGGCQVLLGDDGVPVAFRKDEHADTLLVLRNILVNGIPVPKGYLIAASAHSDDRVIAPDCITEAGLLRLTAYAFPPGRRSDFFDVFDFMDPSPQINNTLRNCDISEIASRVGRAITAINGRGAGESAVCCPVRNPSKGNEFSAAQPESELDSGGHIEVGSSIGSVATILSGVIGNHLPTAAGNIDASLCVIGERIESLAEVRNTETDLDRCGQIDRQIEALRQAVHSLEGASAMLAGGSNDVQTRITNYITGIQGNVD